MSLNREGVVWPVKGGFRYGMFDCEVVGDDPEWDVEYDYSTFEYVSPVRATVDEAFNCYDGCNPGGFAELTERDAEAEQYDRMAEKYDAQPRSAPFPLRAFYPGSW